MQKNKSNKAHVIIVGGGIFGCAIAYYFKRDNPDKKVLVFERNELCSANTSLAAALMSRVRSYEQAIPLSIETYKVIEELDKLNEDKLPVHRNGAIHLAVSGLAAKALDDMLLTASKHGIDWQYILAESAALKVPWLNASLASKIAFIPDEATTDPYLLGKAFATAARKLGVEFFRNTEVERIVKQNNTVIGISTGAVLYEANVTILAAGVWSTMLAYNAGIMLPMAAVRSQYWISAPNIKLFPSGSPTVIIPEANFYARAFSDSLLFGIRESESVYAFPDRLPAADENYLYSKDNGMDDLEKGLEKLLPFFPAITDTGIKNYVAGFSAYTPDNQFILGEVPDIGGILVATGCVGAGISVAGGVGLGISRLAAGKPNPFNFNSYRYNRFGNFDPIDPEYLKLCARARSNKTSG